jgi:hypothetical protein
LPELAGAVFSPCRTWRYRLSRRWADGPALLVVALNPSTADETADDPTIRRCVALARREGFAALTMANLFAYRATDPTAMRAAADPVGPDNDAWLGRLRAEHELCVVAWGVHGEHRGRAADVLERAALGATHCLGATAGGQPRHTRCTWRPTRRLSRTRQQGDEMAEKRTRAPGAEYLAGSEDEPIIWYRATCSRGSGRCASAPTTCASSSARFTPTASSASTKTAASSSAIATAATAGASRRDG